MLYLIKHSIFICLCFWVPKHINAIGILPFFFFPACVPFYSTMENKKGLATRNAVCRDVDLECSLALILTTPGFLEPYGFGSLLIIRLQA